MNDFKLLIDGQLVNGHSTLDVLNPATETVLAQSPRASAEQLEQAIQAAKRVFPTWAALTPNQRGDLLVRLAERIEQQAEPLAALLTAEQGKPMQESMFEMLGSAAILRAHGVMDLPLKILRENVHERIVEQRTPLGVVAAILPWNVPIFLLTMKLAPALLAGNTLVVKPAPTTPLTTLRLGEIFAELFPPGVVNVVVDNNDLGAALTSHPDIAKISFTGSTATGRKVMASSASTLKRLTLELGGNDAAIVLQDMDTADAAQKVFGAAMYNAGQICLAPKRVYVPEAMYEDVCNELAVLARSAIVDDGSRQGTQIGPLQNRAQYEKVKEYLADARLHGKIIAGGEPLDRPGYFIPPTIVRDIPDDARLVREEQFGPVLPVLRYTDVDELIRRANDTEYGLGGTIWTTQPERGYEIALKLDTGTVWINKYLDLPVDVRVGGAKQSGIGAELGEEGLFEYTQAKIINMALLA